MKRKITFINMVQVSLIISINIITLIIGIVFIRVPNAIIYETLSFIQDAFDFFFRILLKALLFISDTLKKSIGGELYEKVMAYSKKKNKLQEHIEKNALVREFAEDIKSKLSKSEVAELARSLNS